MKRDDILEIVRAIIEDDGLKERTRKTEKVFPRFFLMNFLRVNTGMTLSKIAEEFNILTKDGIGDHSTILHGIRSHKNLKRQSVYLFYTGHIEDRLSGVEPEDNKVLPLEDRVLLCENYKQLLELQKELR